MECAKRFSIDRLLQMLDEALTREKAKHKIATQKVSDREVDSNFGEHRHRVLSWLADLSDKFNFSSETLFLSIAIFDRFLASVKAHPKYLNCIGVACFYLAAKSAEEDNVLPDTLTLVRSSECGCSVAEVLRMERCILNKLDWDVRLATPLDFLYIYHMLLMSRCPRVLEDSTLSASQHVGQLTRRLQSCLLDPQLSGFTPSTVALGVLSLDLELFLGWQLWLPATVTLQALAQIPGRDLVWCRELVANTLPGSVVRAALLAPGTSLSLHPKPGKRKVDDVVTDDFYDGIKRLYAEDASLPSEVAGKITCAGEVLRCPSAPPLQNHDFITRVNN